MAAPRSAPRPGPSAKFGTFGGVYTPSLLTILGVIMYLRLPWVVGNAGLYTALGIILVAHVVSVCTGLSISSVATDKKVGVGGPYYIVSRSFGLPIGGAIGGALFLGLSFSISLYIIGFSESFLGYFGVEPTADNIRICGTATILGITAITFISTSFAIKTQYLIMALIAGSLVSIALGKPSTDAPLLSASPDSPSLPVLFGIFFPAVTGFTAGVNMSGDLKDPKRSIPRGTLLAIATGLVVYVGLAVFFALRIDPAQLRGNPRVLQETAWFAPAVVAGIWGATLSSALGSILGAPRILQAMARDRIAPRFFARGHGAANEPRNALLLAFAIGEAGILIAELDVIARVVSMVFLAMYASVNLVAAAEGWVSPDFRPSFKIPRAVSLVGAITALLLMIQLDLIAMLGAAVAMLALFASIKRRQLALESGDAWEGIWSNLVRAGLFRLSRARLQQRNWRPNVLMFRPAGAPAEALREFAGALISGSGLLTDVRLGGSVDASPEPAAAAEAAPVGLFERAVPTDRPFEAVQAMCRHHGFAGLAPNTVVLPWSWRDDGAGGADFIETLRVAASCDLNLLLFDPRRSQRLATEPAAGRGQRRAIHAWWSMEAGNFALDVALLRMLTRSDRWATANLVIHLIVDERHEIDALRARAAQMLREARVDATVRTLPLAMGQSHVELIRHESRDADLVLVGLPRQAERLDQALLERLEQVAALPGGVVFTMASSGFPEVLRAMQRRVAAPADDATGEQLAIDLPADPVLATALSKARQSLAGEVDRFCDGFLARAYAELAAVAERARALLEQRHAGLAEAAEAGSQRERRRRVARVERRAAEAARALLEELGGELLEGQRQALADATLALLEPGDSWRELPVEVRVDRPRKLLAAAEGDDAGLRAWKRGQRWRWFYRRVFVQRVPLLRLAQYHRDQLLAKQIAPAVLRFERESHELAIELGRLLTGSSHELYAALFRPGGAGDRAEAARALVASLREVALDTAGAIVEQMRTREQEARRRGAAAVHGCFRALVEDASRIDAEPLALASRGPDPAMPARRAELAGAADAWAERQKHAVARAALGLSLERFRLRLTLAVSRVRDELAAGVAASAAPLDRLRAAALAEPAPASAPTAPGAPAPTPSLSDPRAVVPPLSREIDAMIAELPERVDSLTDESMAAMARGELDAVEACEIGVRHGLQLLVDSHLVATLEAECARLLEQLARASAVATSVSHLLAAGVVTAEAEEPEADAAEEPRANARARAAERLVEQRERLLAAGADLDEALDRALEAIFTQTASFELASSLAAARPQSQRRGRWRTRARDSLARGLGRLRKLAVRAVYRRSAGVVSARGRGGADAALSSNRRVRECVAACEGDAEALETVPFYYRHMFAGQLSIPDGLWVGREGQLRVGRQTLAEARPGQPCLLLISGARGSGKSALCQRLAAAAGATPIWVSAPPGGSGDPDELRAQVARALGLDSAPADLALAIPDDALLVFDDVELWWERRPGGLGAIDALLELCRGGGAGRARFLVAGETRAIRMLAALRPISRRAAATLVCEPFTAEQLERALLLRHESTGLRFTLGKRDEAGMTEWSTARLFDRYFDYTGGNIGFAQRTWLASVTGHDDGVVRMRAPGPRDWEALDELPADLTGLIVDLLLHRAASEERLARITGDAGYVRDGLATLERVGLVQQTRERVVTLNPAVIVPLVERLERKGLA